MLPSPRLSNPEEDSASRKEALELLYHARYPKPYTSADAAIQALRTLAKNHQGCSSGEGAAWKILHNFETGDPCDFLAAFIELDGTRKQAILCILNCLATNRPDKFSFCDLRQ